LSARGWLLLLVVALVGVVATFVWMRLEGTPPEIRGPENLVLGAQGGRVPLEVSDGGSGLRSVSVTLSHPDGEVPLYSRDFPGTAFGGAEHAEETLAFEVEIDAKKIPRRAAQAFLRVSVHDWSWRGGLGGNQARVDVPVTLDRKPPRIAVFSGLTYVRRGGSGVVVYQLSEETTHDGVTVGETFFPSYPLGDRRVAFFAVPTDAPPNPPIRVVATDAAGNEGRARWPVRVNERKLPSSDVRLPSYFLEDKVSQLAAYEGIEEEDLREAFRVINTELRARNENHIREALADTAGEKLWEGAFQQLPNSKVTSRFAEHRRYLIDGEPISEATHFGYDLASTQAAPVTAAAAGRVVFADELGIYGNCVLVDHGLGVGSLYGHLSRLDVQPGEELAPGDVIGLSGETGLAGGDHLHFAILVGGVYVDPLEWWDASWMRKNVEERLAATRP